MYILLSTSTTVCISHYHAIIKSQVHFVFCHQLLFL